MSNRALILIFQVIFCLILSACSAFPLPQDRETIYQTSTLASLMAGSYDGVVTASDLSNKGDFGIGTFHALDGEMILLNGHFFQAKADGTVVEPSPQITLPFSAVTFFDSDSSLSNVSTGSYDELKQKIDPFINDKNAFYAIRIEGDFSHIKVRSVPVQNKPYPVLTEVTKNQPVFDYKNTSGTLVGFWCPSKVGTLNVPGYHLHFLSKDHTQGGHLLEIGIISAKISLDQTPAIKIDNQPRDSSSDGVDLSGDIDQVEK